ncbi:hypothetical protein LFT44_09115 [Arthrobacter sp. FW306-05-C]|uniref:LexA family protein n=1 Tax=Arthrobacter sp. FW306-05-C TaxID=2879620 RepID=UPI001F2BB66D|nr:S24 family peptidase [Arthrobacter sp. FW306-05-C]UKA68523.1 hypothetical protein LFT44_09115 [Arthrobacter sp. FW306-05-C]
MLLLDTRTAIVSGGCTGGFPSPAQGCFTGRIDLNKHLIKNITGPFLAWVAGHPMADAGIADGDELVVDRSITPVDGSVVVAIIGTGG